MRILQFVDNTKQNSSLRFSLSINKLFNEMEDISCDVQNINIDNMFEFIRDMKINEELIKHINSYDYIFVHSLPLSEEIYNIINKAIYTKIIFFINEFNINELADKTSLRAFPVFLRRCYRIFIHHDSRGIKEYIHKHIGVSIDTHLKYFNYICESFNFDTDISYKNNDMIIISNKGLGTDFKLYLNMFLFTHNLNAYKELVDWFAYGVVRNIQMISIKGFYENANEDPNIIDSNKINVRGIIPMDYCHELMKNSSFVCFFDNTTHINYTLLDIIQNGTIPIIPIDIAKKIKVNNKQTLYDIKFGILIDPQNLEDTFIQIKSLVENKGAYIRLRNTLNNIIRRLYDTNTIIENILNDIK